MSRNGSRVGWSLACAVFALALGFAVFSFGSPVDPWRTRAVRITGVSALLLLAGLRAWRGAPLGWRAWLPAVAWLWLFTYAVFMLWNAKARHLLTEFQFHWLDPPFPDAPGTLSLGASSGAPLEIAVLALIFACGWLAARRGCEWLVLIKILVGMAVAVALFGVLHKVTGATAVWWLEDRVHPKTFFAPFVYHAHAGAFLNLMFPLAIAGALAVGHEEESRGARWAWLAVAAVIGGATLITTSKGAVLMILGGILLQVFAHRRRIRFLVAAGRAQAVGRRFERGLMSTLVLAGVALILLIGWEGSLVRFEEFHNRVPLDELQNDSRIRVAKIIAAMCAPDAGGLWGYGPGTFVHLFPYFTHHMGDDLQGFWQTGHNDWLQMFAEWGWIGGTAWLVFGPGALIAGMLTLRNRRYLEPHEAPYIRGTMIGLIVTGLHGSFDFPFQMFPITLVAILMAGFLWGKQAVVPASRGSGSGSNSGSKKPRQSRALRRESTSS